MLAFVIAHYHPQGKVPENLFNLIKNIAKLSNKIVFVSTEICESEINKLSPYATVISRENFGYDFWSYKIGMEALGDLKNIERLVFLNSSFITINPRTLCNLFLGPIEGKALRGLTISYFPKLHVQSYLFAFEDSSLINSIEFQKWWDNMIPISDRNEVIHHYEIGMSDWFIQQGIPIKSVFKIPRKEILLSTFRAAWNLNWKFSKIFKIITFFEKQLSSKIKIHKSLNPTHFFWHSLYLQSTILKIDLLKSNPTNQDLSKLFNQIDQTTLSLIKDAINES